MCIYVNTHTRQAPKGFDRVSRAGTLGTSNNGLNGAKGVKWWTQKGERSTGQKGGVTGKCVLAQI